MAKKPHPVIDSCAKAAAWHGRLRTAIDRLDKGFAEVGAARSLTDPWNAFTRGMGHHMKIEEEILFPAIVALAEGRTPPDNGFEGPLTDLHFELDEVRTLADKLRDAGAEAGKYEKELRAILDELEEHARLEDAVVFPAGMDLLAAWEAAQGDDDSEEAPAGNRSTGMPADEELGAVIDVLRHTRGTCNECSQDVPAKVVQYEKTVQLEKYCPDHGTTRQLLSRAPEYWATLDRYYFRVNSENYQQRDFIVRMTETCNLDCPICLAKANTEETPDLDLSGLENLLSQRRGIKLDLMAAEPTLRKDLEDWVRRVKETGNIAALHTNGLKLASLEFAQRMKDCGVDEVFLQFDGFDDEANKFLRGVPLLKTRLKALENLRKVGLATSLIVVVGKGLNEAEVARTYRFALQPENSHIREVFWLGLRVLGSARDTLKQDSRTMLEMSMMPDETLDLLVRDEPSITREDVQDFNKFYFAMLSAFRVKKCLYVQHYMVERDGRGGARPISEIINLKAMALACDRYAERLARNPQLARARLLADLARASANRETFRMTMDLVKMQVLLKVGMNLHKVPERFLILGFITACDPHNFDSQVAVNCGKGELSVDGGFIDSGAVANVRREARFDDTDLRPGEKKRKKREQRKAPAEAK